MTRYSKESEVGSNALEVKGGGQTATGDRKASYGEEAKEGEGQSGWWKFIVSVSARGGEGGCAQNGHEGKKEVERGELTTWGNAWKSRGGAP